MPTASESILAKASPGTAPVRFSPLLFTAFLIAAFGINYPGRMNEDSLWQFIGWANPEQMNDLHSPFVTWMWSLPASLLGQPQSALLVQSAVLAIFAATVPARFPARPIEWVALAIELLLKLLLLSIAGIIIKDALLLGLLLAGLAGLQLCISGRRPRLWLAVALALFALSLTIRPINIGMFFVAMLLIIPLLGRPSRRGLALGAAAAAVVLLVAPAQIAANRWIFRAHAGNVERQVQMFDMAGISMLAGRDQFAKLPGWTGAGLPPLSGCYRPDGWDSLASWGKCSGYWREMERTIALTGRRGFATWWIKGIAENPGAYARHRLAFMHRLLFGPDPSYRAPLVQRLPESQRSFHHYALNSPERIEDFRRSAQGNVRPADFSWWRGNPAFRALSTLLGGVFEHIWASAVALALCFILIGWSWIRKLSGRPVDLVLATAAGLGIGNAAIYLFFGIAAQDRYLYPTLCCALFALIAALRSFEKATERAG